MDIDYDAMAVGYDSHYASEESEYENNIIKAYIERYIDDMGSVLDLGCGTGFFRTVIDCRSYLGIDISDSMIRIAREKLKGYPNTKVEVESSQRFIFERFVKRNDRPRFDVISSCFSLPYIGAETGRFIPYICNTFIGVVYRRPYEIRDSVYYGKKLGYWFKIKPRVELFLFYIRSKAISYHRFPIDRGYDFVIARF